MIIKGKKVEDLIFLKDLWWRHSLQQAVCTVLFNWDFWGVILFISRYV